MARIIVLGAGAMGLAAAYRALKLGHEMTLIEAAPEAGGMAAHFDLAGLSIERFYHFVCKADAPTFALMREIGIGDKMRWRGDLDGLLRLTARSIPWGDPVSLLKFPHLSVVEKLRYGLLMFVSTRRDRWEALEHLTAKEWITRWCGARVYEKLWRPLFDLKFHEYADNISASWIWTRVKRLGRSRKSLLREELGYIDGGSQTLVEAPYRARSRPLAEKSSLGEPARQVHTRDDGRVTGVATLKGEYAADVGDLYGADAPRREPRPRPAREPPRPPIPASPISASPASS